jgi:class III poly(R)-hydroxyalkanoic acid synthase PhaE subunit
MGERDATSGWMREWQAMQDQFLSAWREAMKGGSNATGVPLHEGLDLWARLASGRLADDALGERMVAGARQIAGFLEKALEAAGVARRDTAGGIDAEAWREAMARAFGALGLDRNPVLDALRAGIGEGAASFEQWSARLGEALAPLRQSIEGWLSAPTFGFHREAQERQQRLARALLAQAEADRAYHALLLKAAQLAISRFEGKLADRDAPGRRIRSGRELYDLWIDAAEEAYAEVAMSAEFGRAYADMVNAQMRVRRAVQREVELLAAQLGMPTRAEVDASHRRVAELSRRLAALEERLAGGASEWPAASRSAATDAPTPSAVGASARDEASPRAPGGRPDGGQGPAGAAKASKRAAGKGAARATKRVEPAKSATGGRNRSASFAEALARSRAKAGADQSRRKEAKG